MKRVLSLTFIVLFSSVLFAGYFAEFQYTTNGKTDTQKMWIDENGFRIETQKSVILYRNADKVVFQIYKEKKQYVSFTIEELKQMMSSASQMYKQFMQGSKPRIERTGETKVINGFKCYKVIIEMGPLMKEEGWFTDDIVLPENIKSVFVELTASMLPPDVKEKFKSLGFAVETYQKTSMMGNTQEITSKLLKIKKLNLPASIFKYNLSGYKKISMFGGR